MQLTTHTRFGIGALFGALAAPDLPAELVTDWDANGTPSGTLSKTAALVLLPITTPGVVGLLAALPQTGPLGKKSNR